jgi:hypothetical protein
MAGKTKVTPRKDEVLGQKDPDASPDGPSR